MATEPQPRVHAVRPMPSTMHRVIPFALLAGVALLVGCSEAPATSTSLVQRDSAGVRIVENPANTDEATRLWHLAASPDMEIGLTDGAAAYALSGIVDALRTVDGGVAIADQDSREIRFFDAAGRHLRSVGGRGGGPGEFESLSALGRFRGDSLAVWDNRAGRLSILTKDGSFGRAVSARDLSMFPSFHGSFADGSWVVSPGFNPAALLGSEQTGEHRLTLTLLRIAPEGEHLDTIGVFPGPEVIADRRGVVSSKERIVFGREFAVAVGSAHLHGGDTDRFEVRSYAAEGSLERVVRLAHTPVQVTTADVERHRAREAEMADADYASMPPGMRAALEQAAAARTPPPHRPTFPAFALILVDDRENLWVAEYPAPGASHVRWRVFDRSGIARGFVDVTAGLVVRDIADEQLIVTVKDADGVERVRRYRLEPAT